MGSFFSKLFSMFRDTKARILILGLDNAGKTTILYRLQVGEVVKTIPTVGFNIETLKYENLTLQVFDLGGQTSIRPYWRCYYGSDIDAIIYVVDSCDKQRLETSKNELFGLLEEDELKHTKLVIFANKQDLKEAMSVKEIHKEMNLEKIKNRTYQIFKTSAVTGDGLKEGMKWLCAAIK